MNPCLIEHSFENYFYMFEHCFKLNLYLIKKNCEKMGIHPPSLASHGQCGWNTTVRIIKERFHPQDHLGYISEGFWIGFELCVIVFDLRMKIWILRIYTITKRNYGVTISGQNSPLSNSFKICFQISAKSGRDLFK